MVTDPSRRTRGSSDRRGRLPGARSSGCGRAAWACSSILSRTTCVAGDANAWWLGRPDTRSRPRASRTSSTSTGSRSNGSWRGRSCSPCWGDFYGKVLERSSRSSSATGGSSSRSARPGCRSIRERTTRSSGPGSRTSPPRAGPEAVDVTELRSILTAVQHLPMRHETAPEKVAERYRESGRDREPAATADRRLTARRGARPERRGPAQRPCRRAREF